MRSGAFSKKENFVEHGNHLGEYQWCGVTTVVCVKQTRQLRCPPTSVVDSESDCCWLASSTEAIMYTNCGTGGCA